MSDNPDRRERMALAACDLCEGVGPCQVPAANCLQIAARCLAIADAEHARLKEALSQFVLGFDAHNGYLRDTYGPHAVRADEPHIAVARALLAELGQ